MGNFVSSRAWFTCAQWGIDVLIAGQKCKPIAYLRAIDDGSNVQTRMCQYEALNNSRAFEIAKQFVKIEG